MTTATEKGLHWEDSRWRRSHARRDCGIFAIVFTSTPLTHKPVVCDPVFDSPTGRILQGGAIVSSTDGNKIFAVAAPRPFLTIAQPDGQILKDVSYLEPQEAAPSYTVEDEKQQYASPEQALAIRDRFPAFLGIARWKQAVGLLFRENDGGVVRFSMDLFSYSGEKLANDVGLPFPDGTDRAHVLLINAPDGRVFAIFRDRALEEGRWHISRQELVELAATRESAEPRASLLRFELRDALSGEPVRFAQASLARDGRTAQHQLGDARGIFEIPIPPGRGPAHLTIGSNGYLPGGLELSSEQAETGDDAGTLFLGSGIAISGTLLNADTGTPLVGAQISVTRHHLWGSLAARWLGNVTSTVSDASGSFRLGGLEPGSACLRIEHPLVAELGMPVPSTNSSNELLELGTVWMGGGVSLAGRLVDADGMPVIDARVELRSGPWRNPCLRLVSSSAEEGRFIFHGVNPGDVSVLALQRHQVGALRRIRVPKQSIDIGNLRLHDREIDGHIHLAEGASADGTLTLTREGASTFSPPPVFFARRSGHQDLVSDLDANIVASVEKGSFSTRGFLPPGSAIATFIPTDRSERGTVFRARVNIPPEDQPATLSLDWSGKLLEGSVADVDGEPVQGATVELDASGLAIRSTVSGADGRFVIDGAPLQGGYRVRAQLGDLRGEDTTEQDSEVKLILRPRDSGTVTIAISPSDTASEAGNAIALTSESDLYNIRQTDSIGRVIFEDIDPGTYKVAAVVRGALATGPQLTVPFNGAEARAFIDPQAGQVVEALLGEKLLGSEAVLLSEDGTSFSPLLGFLGVELVADEAGRLTTPPLTRGRWQLYFPALDRRFPFRVDTAQGSANETKPFVVDLR